MLSRLSTRILVCALATTAGCQGWQFSVFNGDCSTGIFQPSLFLSTDKSVGCTSVSYPNGYHGNSGKFGPLCVLKFYERGGDQDDPSDCSDQYAALTLTAADAGVCKDLSGVGYYKAVCVDDLPEVEDGDSSYSGSCTDLDEDSPTAADCQTALDKIDDDADYRQDKDKNDPSDAFPCIPVENEASCEISMCGHKDFTASGKAIKEMVTNIIADKPDGCTATDGDDRGKTDGLYEEDDDEDNFVQVENGNTVGD